MNIWRGQIIPIEILYNVYVDVYIGSVTLFGDRRCLAQFAQDSLTVQKHFSFDPLDTQILCVTLSNVRAATWSSMWFLPFMPIRALLSKLIFLA